MAPREDLAVGPVPPVRPDRALHSDRGGRARATAAVDHAIRGVAAEAALVGETRRRVRLERAPLDRRSGLITGGAFFVTVGAWLALAPPRELPAPWFAASIVAYIVAGLVEFEIGPGSALPTTPVLVVMLFLLPPQWVPVAVVTGLAGAAFVARLRDPTRRERVIVLAGSGWHAVGPAAVFAAAHLTRPRISDAHFYVLALLSQFTFDAISSWIRNCYGLGVPLRQLTAALRFTFLNDMFLAPIGFAAVLASPDSPGALLFLLPPIALLAMLQVDRRKHIDRVVALSDAVTDTSVLARRDALTGLPNRLAWEEATARYDGSETALGVMFADVDGLKKANDEYGHDLGDQLLVAVADVISRTLAASTGAVVARLGGDEFAMLVPDASIASTHAIASALRAAFGATPALAGAIPVSASVGVGFAARGAQLTAALAEADRGVNVDKVTRGVRRR